MGAHPDRLARRMADAHHEAEPFLAAGGSSLADSLADSLRVGEGTQVLDAVKLGAWHVQAAGHGAGGHQNAVIVQALVPL